MPATVQTILAARIDRLPAEEKRLLQAASVIGKDVPSAILTAIAELPDEPLRRALGHLREAEFLYETILFPDLEYTFKHALTHEVTYSSLLLDRRRILHGRIVETIERLSPNRLAEQIDRLAHHAFRGEAWEKAVTYLRQAGVNAFARSANREAVVYFEQSLLALGRLPETRERLERAIDLRFDLQAALFPLGELERMLATLREAEELARALDNPRRLGWASVYGCFVLGQTGRLIEARALGDKALAIGETLDDRSLLVVARYYRGMAHLGSDYGAATELFRKNVRALEGDLYRERHGLYGFPAAMSRGWLAWALAERGEFEEGLVVGQEGIRMGESLDHPFTIGGECLKLAQLHRIRGEFAPAVRLLDRTLTLSRDWNIRLLSAMGASSLGYVYAILGRVAEGLELLHQAHTAMESTGHLLFRPFVLIHLGEARLLAGGAGAALEPVCQALMLARERSERGYEAWALRLLAELASHPDCPDVTTAEAHYCAAMALASELGMRPLVAHCHLGLGKLYRRTGKREQAHEHLTTATTMYREMGMTYWLEQAEAETAALA